jgi:hypothetical protein
LAITLSVALIVGVFSFYFIKGVIPVFLDLTSLDVFAGYIYPILCGVIVVFLTSIYLSFKDVNILSNALLLLLISMIVEYFADLAYTYTIFNNVYAGFGITSSILYIIEYILAGTSFYWLASSLEVNEK